MGAAAPIAACLAVGAAGVAVERWWEHRRACREALVAARRFEEAVERSVAVPSDLAPLVAGARRVRLSLASLVRRSAALPRWALSMGAGLAAYDHGIDAARFTLWEWILEVYRLPRYWKVELSRAGFSPRPLEELVLRSPSFERTRDPYGGMPVARVPDPPVVVEALAEVGRILDRFEAAARSLLRSPYR